ncbi:hypothetical protein NLC35_01965 [Candidatus Aminicenantes bacterium AC-334-K16]|jgi:cytochrome c biogenesis protein CcdA|nr:hypothetical protein [Candidatus Aminicenantes bacterium AC-334-K16]
MAKKESSVARQLQHIFRRTSRILSLVLLSLFLLNSPSSSQSPGKEIVLEIYFFFEAGCPFSQKISKFLTTRIEPHYPVKIKRLEIHESNNLQLMMKMARACQAEEIIRRGVPVVYIGPYAFQGASRQTERLIETTIRKIIQQKEPLSLKVPPPSGEPSGALSISYPLIFGTGFLSAFNPCSLGVFLLFLGTLITLTGFQKRRLLAVGLLFSLTYFSGSLLVGLGLLHSLQGINIRQPLTFLISLLAIGGGLYYLWTGISQKKKDSLPPGWRKLVLRFLNIPGAIVIGALAVFFLFPCSSGPYLAILALLSQPAWKGKAISGLILYNFAFILPFLLLTLVLGGGFSWQRIVKWKDSHLNKLKILLGGLLLFLGIWLLLTLI